MEKAVSLSLSQFSLSADKKELLFTILKNQENVSAVDIINLFKNSPFRNFKIYKNGFKEIITVLLEIKKGQTNPADLKPIIIAECFDAELSITFNQSKTMAKAQIIASFGGRKITEKQFIEKLHELKIQIGVNQSAIKLLLKKSFQAPPGATFQITIATGKPVIEGHDSYFSALVAPPKEQLVNSIEKDYGSVDISAIEKLLSIQPGTGLIRKFTHLVGQDGLTVTNEIISHTVGHDIPFQIGENTEISKSDPNLLVSSVFGTPIQLEIGMKVEKTLILDDFVNRTTPVVHEGTLIIRGDVPPGAKITATGNITVIGFIESSEVKCGGDLFVSKGIIGEGGEDKNKHRSKIECDGSIYANFIQYSTIITKQDINLQYQLIHSDVFCDGFIKVETKDQQKGVIFGGYLSAKKGIQTITLGATSGVKTTLDLNGCYMELLDEEKKSRLSLVETKDKIGEMLAAQVKLNDSKNSEKVMQLRKRLSLTIKDLQKQAIDIQNEVRDIENKIQQCLRKTNVNVLKTIYTNVSVGLGKQLFTSARKYGSTTLHIKNKRLVAESYKK